MKQNQDGKLKKGKLNIVLMEYLVILGCLITLFVMLVPKERITNNANSYAKPEEVTKYLLSDGYMTRIRPLTEYSTFKEIAENTINSDSQSDKYVVKVYADKEKNKEIKDGYITSGMTVECSLLETELESNEQSGNNNVIASELDVESEEKKVTDYIANVIGDISQDGDCNITELTQMIMHIIGMERLNDQGKELSADFNGDNNIDVTDVSMCINYIVYGTMEADKTLPQNPVINVSGEGNEVAGWYRSDINIDIEDNAREDGEINKTQTTVDMKLEGNDRISTQSTTEKQFKLSKNGTFKISAQNYGSNGTRSQIVTKTVNIDKTIPEFISAKKQKIDDNTYRIDIEANDNIGIIKYRIIRENEEQNVKEVENTKEFRESVNIKQDGNYKIVVEDIAGNTAEQEIKIEGLNKEFSIRFLNDDGSTITRQICKEGETIEIPNNPIKPEDEMYTYTFAGWSPEVNEIAQANVDYTAVFEKTPKQYTIRFLGEDRSLVEEKIFNSTDKGVEEPTPPEKEGYVGVWPEYELKPENMEVVVEYLEAKDNGAEYYTEVNGITWRYVYQDGKATNVYYQSGELGQEVDIPKKLDGYQVESIEGRHGNNMFNNAGDSIYRNIEKINIPYGIKTISDYTFADCRQLTEIDIPDSVNNIKGYAFAWCYNLENIKWSENLERIEYNAFCDGDNLQKLQLPEGLEYIGNRAFNECNNLKEVIIPDSVTTIEGNAFAGNHNLIGVKLPNNLRSLTYGLFGNCEKLDTIEIPESVENIEGDVFSYCNNLKELNIPKNVYSISGQAFNDCNNLERIQVDEENSNFVSVDGILFTKDMQTIVRYPEGKKDISEYTIPEGIISISEYAFYNTDVLKNIEIPNTVSYIGSSAFEQNDSISEIILPEGLTEINSNIFRSCYNLENVTIPDSVTRIGNGAFNNCTKILNVDIPQSVLFIEGDAFSWSGIETIDLPSGITEISYSTFNGCNNLKNIRIPGNVTDIRSSAFSNCRNLTDIYIDNTEENVNFENSWDMYAYIHYNDCKHRIDFEMDSDIINIQDVSGNLEDSEIKCGETYQFKLVSSEGETLKDKQIMLRSQGKFTNTEEYMQMITPDEEGIYSIKNVNRNIVVNANYEISDEDKLVAEDEYGISWNYTYRNGNAEDIYYQSGEIGETLNIPSQLNGFPVTILNSTDNESRTILGTNPWDSSAINNKIRNVNIPDGIQEIKEYAFSNFKGIKNITIPDSVVSIGYAAFRDCESIEEINVGDGLQILEGEIFVNCKSLKNLVIPGNVKNIGSSAFAYCDNLIEINIENGVESISGSAFQGCKSLKVVNIPSSVKEIKSDAFNCENLTDIYVDNYEEDVSFEDGWTPYAYAHYKECKHDIEFEKYTNIYTTVEEISNNVQDGKIDCQDTYQFRLLNKQGKVITSERVLATFTGKPVDYKDYERIRRMLDNASYVFTNEEEGTIELEPDENGIYTIENVHRNVTVIVGSYRATDDSGITWNYSYENGQATNVYYESGNLGEVVNIPSELNGYTVKSLYNKESAKNIFDRAENKDSIKVVNIPEEVETVNNYAFYKMKNIERIELPEGTTKIGYAAFYSCENLKNINISNTVTEIGKWAFAGSSKLDNVVIPENVTKIGEAAFSGCTSLTNINILANIEVIEEYLFRECTKLKEIEIPEGIVKIEESAFNRCENLQNIKWPETLTTIDERAFANCTSLKELSLQNGISTIKNAAFEYCYNLRTVEIPSTIREIGEAFNQCYNLSDVYIDALKSDIILTTGKIYGYGPNAYIHYKDCKHNISVKIYSDDIEAINVTNNVENGKIPCRETYKFKLVDNQDNVLTNCIVVKRIKTNNGITSETIYPDDDGIYTIENINKDTIIGVGERYRRATDNNGITWEYSYVNGEATDVHYSGTMEGDFGEILDIPETLEGYPVTSLYNPNNDTITGDNGCNILLSNEDHTIKTINIPNTVKEIGTKAFKGFRDVENINIPDSVTSIGDYAFAYCCNIVDLQIPDTVTKIGKRAFYECSKIENITIPSGVIDIEEGTYRTMRELKSIEIPTGVITIGDSAFEFCEHLQKVDMSNSVVIIGERAFSHCGNLSEINFSNNLKSIGYEAFCECNSLISIEIPESVETIGKSAFAGCKNLETVTLNEGLKKIGDFTFGACEKLSNLDMPRSVEYIGEGAFSGCTNLNTIVIWDNVNEVGKRAFERWINTQTINIEKEKAPSTWNNEWKKDCNAEIVFAYIGE